MFIKKSHSVVILSFMMTIIFLSVSHGQQRSNKDLAVEEFNKRHINPDVYAPQKPQGGGQEYPSPESYYGSFNKPLDVIIGNEDVSYKIVPGDSLTIAFHDRNDVTKAIYQVSGRGEIFFPLIGPVEVLGLNRNELKQRIDQRLKKFIRRPDSEIEINTNGKVMVVGSVTSPGIYSLTPRFTLMEAIITARYDETSAKLKNIVVMRGPPDKPEIRMLDLQKMIKKGDRSDNIFLKPGDLVYVPNSHIKNLENFVGNIYEKVLMWYGLGGNQITD